MCIKTQMNFKSIILEERRQSQKTHAIIIILFIWNYKKNKGNDSYRSFWFLMAELEGSYNREVIAPSRYADTVNLFCILILEVAI